MVVCDPSSFVEVKEALAGTGLPEPVSAQVAMMPLATVKLTGKEAESMLKLYTKLDDHEDVQNVYADFDIDDELIEQFTG